MPLPTKCAAEEGVGAGRTPEALTDEETIRRILAGDNACFELILRRYNQRLFRVARSIVGEDSEAEDVVQEAYLRAYQNLARFEGRSTFSTWLTKIAVHEATTRRRKLRRRWLRPASESEIDDMSLHSSDRSLSADDAGNRELRHVLVSAIDALSTDLRVVFTLRMVEQLSTEQTAECLDLTPANVKIRLHRARLRLRETIDRQIGEESRQLFMFDGERCDRIVRAVMSRLPGAP